MALAQRRGRVRVPKPPPCKAFAEPQGLLRGSRVAWRKAREWMYGPRERGRGEEEEEEEEEGHGGERW